MSKYVLGITAGRKNGNSEILLKEALLKCQEEGAEVGLINLRDYDILDCSGCTACTKAMSMGKAIECPLNKHDDKAKLTELMLSADAVIFSAPTYDLMACSTYLKFMMRNLSYETAFLESIGAIEHKYRVCGLIAVGGSTRSWQSMALETMQATMFTCDFKVIDMILAKRVPAPGQCLLDEDLMEETRVMGSHIMESLATDPAERKWLGDPDMGWCPNCHSNALILGEVQWDGLHYPVECQVCGAGGNLEKDENGKMKFIIQEDGLARDRTTLEGRTHHVVEIGETQGGFFSNPEKRNKVNELKEKYINLDFTPDFDKELV